MRDTLQGSSGEINVGEEVSVQGEDAFREKCNRWRCEYLPLSQKVGYDMSLEIREKGAKRPDFLVTVPDIGPILVDIKAKKRNDRTGTDKIPSFSVDIGDHEKLKKLEMGMHLSIWYAYFEKRGEDAIVRDTVYFVPLTRVDRYLNRPELAQAKKKGYVYLPLDCMNRCTDELDLRDKCFPCGRKASCASSSGTS